MHKDRPHADAPPPPRPADADRWRRVHIAGDRNPPIRLNRGKIYAFAAKGPEVRHA